MITKALDVILDTGECILRGRAEKKRASMNWKIRNLFVKTTPASIRLLSY